jgi:hypothetical protein
MTDWEIETLHVVATNLKHDSEAPSSAEIAHRLSEAILRVVEQKSLDGWQMAKMEFSNGRASLQFRRRPITPPPQELGEANFP